MYKIAYVVWIHDARYGLIKAWKMINAYFYNMLIAEDIQVILCRH